MVELPSDFRDVLVALADAGADVIVVGGYAVAYYGYPRATKDLDVFVRPEAVNGRRVFAALAAFGAPLARLGVSADDFATPGRVIQIGLPPLRIDVINQLDGVDFDVAGRDAGTFDVDGRSIRVIGRAALLANKRAMGRPQDLSDVVALERLGADDR